jgi:hypothetical protein
MYTEAAKPARSVTAPPPAAISSESREKPCSNRKEQSAPACSSVLAFSEGGSQK